MTKELNNPLPVTASSKLFGRDGDNFGEFPPSFLGVHNLLHIQDRKTQNTHGGTFTLGAWRLRDLNTVVVNNITGSSLSANKITLPIGSYFIEAFSEAYAVGIHRLALYETTLGSVLPSRSHFVSPTAYAQNAAHLSGYVTFSAVAEVFLQHISASTQANTGFRCAGNFGVEIYSDIKIWKLT